MIHRKYSVLIAGLACLAAAVIATNASAQTILVQRNPNPATASSGVIGGWFTDRPGEEVSPLTVVTFSQPVTVGSVTIFTTNLFGNYPIGSSGTAVLNIFFGSELDFFANTLTGGPFGLASTPVTYVATANGLEITAGGLDINLFAGTFLIGLTPILNYGANSQEFIQDAGAAGQTTFLNNTNGGLFSPPTVNASSLDLPTPFTGMAIRITADNGVLLGDLNGDGQVNLLDVSPFVDAVVSGTFIPEADINGDGEVNLLDIAPFVALLTG